MAEEIKEKDGWGEYSKLVIKELERLNEGQEKMRADFDSRFKEMNDKLSETKNLEKTVNEHKLWIEKVTDVWSPIQMKEAKNEIYEQKGKWQRTAAVFVVIQILIGIIIALLKFIPS